MISKLRLAGIVVALIATVLTFTLPFHLLWVAVALLLADLVLLPVLVRMERRAASE